MFSGLQKFAPCSERKKMKLTAKKVAKVTNFQKNQNNLQYGCFFSEEFLGALEVFGGVNAYRFDVGKTHADAKTVLQPAQLFQTFGNFER